MITYMMKLNILNIGDANQLSFYLLKRSFIEIYYQYRYKEQ